VRSERRALLLFRQKHENRTCRLGNNRSDWQLTVKHLNATLDKFKVADNERTEILTLFAGIKKDIVEKP
jgi:hypothetical protein